MRIVLRDRDLGRVLAALKVAIGVARAEASDCSIEHQQTVTCEDCLKSKVYPLARIEADLKNQRRKANGEQA